MQGSRKFLIILAYGLGLYFFSTQVPRADTWVLFLCFFSFFGLYVWMLFQKICLTWVHLLCAAAFLRLCVSTEIPWLTDDFYRFIWDGRLVHAGIHPFAYKPENAPFQAAEYAFLNSKQYYTVYPMVCQVVCFFGAFGKSPFGAALIIRAFLLAAELGTIAILARRFGTERAAWYAFNPLIIIEICGNIHFEGLAVFWLTCMMHYLVPVEKASKIESTSIRPDTNLFREGLFFSLAIATKITPLLIAPLLLFARTKRTWLKYFLIVVLSSLVLFLPIIYDFTFVAHLFESLDLYFRDFQINASVFYLLNAVHIWLKGYGGGLTIGPMLSSFLVAVLIWLSHRVFRGRMDIGSAISWAFLTHLWLSTTIHPWYVMVPFAMTFWAKDKRLLPFVVVWTGLIFLSYSHYTNEIYKEKYAIIALEYAGLIGAWIVCTKRKWSA